MESTAFKPLLVEISYLLAKLMHTEVQAGTQVAVKQNLPFGHEFHSCGDL